MALSFTWAGGNTGVWNDPANWTEVSDTPTPATDDPTLTDIVSLSGTDSDPLVIDGPGEADLITLDSGIVLNGSFYVGTLVQSGELTVTGSLIASAGGTISGAVNEMGGGMMVNGLAINGGSLTVATGAFVEIGTDGTADGSNGLVVDANALLTIDSGSLAVGSVLNHGMIFANAGISAPLSGENTGQISGLSADTMVNTGTIASGEGQTISLANVSGGGEVDVSAGGSVQIGRGVDATIVFQDGTGTLSIDADGLATDHLSIQGFSGGDIISIGGLANGATFTPNGWGDGTLTVMTGGGSFSFEVQGDYDSSDTVAFAQNGTVTAGVGLALPCFVTGTLIRTRYGDVPVEALRPGDEIVTLLPDGHRPVRWVGHRSVRPASHPLRADLHPIRVTAGTFGPGLPARDLYLSPDHALFARGSLVPVKHLVNGTSISRVELEAVTYWHVEFDRHDVLLAEGLPAESYLDTGDRASFANGGAVVSLQPRFGALTWEAEGCAPLAVTGPVVEHLRAIAEAMPASTRQAA